MRTQALRAVLLAVVAGAGLVAAAAPPAALDATSVTAAPHLKLSLHSGPPTSTVRVSGTGFGAFRAVDIYFDITDMALAATNGHGAFSGIPVRVPASAVPGTHYITAVQRHSGRSAQARFLVNTNWAQYRYAASHSGSNPYENVLSWSTASGIGLDWSFNTSAAIYSSPAVANGMVYIGSDDHNVYALNAATGAKLWNFATLFSVFSSPAVANGVVYAGSSDGDVYALDARTGTKLWSVAAGAGASSPAVANGVVYIGSDAGKVYALSAATGAKLWAFSPAGAGSTLFSSPAVANGMVYIGNANHHVYALNAATGAKQWTFTAADLVDSSPAVANGVIYIAGHDGNLYAFHLSDGLAPASRPAPGQLHPSHGLQPVR